MTFNDFWRELSDEIALPFEIEDVEAIETNAGSTWIILKDKSSYFIMVEKCEGNEEEKLYERMGNYLSTMDENDYPEIVKALKKALKESPHELIDYVKYKADNNRDFIPVWEKVQERFTVKEFCDLVGIK